MKIGIIVRTLLISGGVERQVMMLAKKFKAAGHTVTMYTYAYDKEACFPGMLDDVAIVELGETFAKASPSWASRIPRLGTLIHELHDMRCARGLAGRIDADTDVLNPHEHTGARVAYYFKRHHPRVSSVLMLSDLHLASWSLFDDPLFGSKRRNILQRAIAWLRDTYENRVFLAAQDRIAVLNFRTADFVKKFLNRTADVVRSGVDTDLFPYHKREGIRDKKIRILCNAIFFVHRRFEDVIAAFPELREKGYDPSLRIVGTYTHKGSAVAYHAKLVALVKELKLEDRVTFVGHIADSHKLLEEYNSADVFVFGSHMQTWGIAVFEAIATGLPTIVSRTAGASEMLTEGKHALLGTPGDPHSYAEALAKLADDPALYDRLSQEGSSYVKETITWDRYAEDLMELFAQARASRS